MPPCAAFWTICFACLSCFGVFVDGLNSLWMSEPFGTQFEDIVPLEVHLDKEPRAASARSPHAEAAPEIEAAPKSRRHALGMGIWLGMFLLKQNSLSCETH